jgi:hypothetical protein
MLSAVAILARADHPGCGPLAIGTRTEFPHSVQLPS